MGNLNCNLPGEKFFSNGWSYMRLTFYLSISRYLKHPSTLRFPDISNTLLPYDFPISQTPFYLTISRYLKHPSTLRFPYISNTLLPYEFLLMSRQIFGVPTFDLTISVYITFRFLLVRSYLQIYYLKRPYDFQKLHPLYSFFCWDGSISV